MRRDPATKAAVASTISQPPTGSPNHLDRLALKLATDTGKAPAIAMLIRWQTVNAVRRPRSQPFTRGFLVVTPGLTTPNRLRTLQPDVPDTCYRSRDLMSMDILGDPDRTKIVITNHRAFMRSETLAIPNAGPALSQSRGPDISTRETPRQTLPYAMDSSTIDLCLPVFPWALFPSTRSAPKLRTSLDLPGDIPTFIRVSNGRMHDVNVRYILVPEHCAFCIMDRGNVDFERLFALHSDGAFFAAM